MIPATVISKFGLIIQDKKSPDGYKIYISENLSHNGPTVFFELVDSQVSAPREIVNKQYLFRITKAGAINHIIIPLVDLETKSFTDLQQAIETALHIPA
jgi:hypothetical protein